MDSDQGVMIKFEDVNIGLLLVQSESLTKFQDCWRYPFQCSDDNTAIQRFFV